jgi:hypothetical protein
MIANVLGDRFPIAKLHCNSVVNGFFLETRLVTDLDIDFCVLDLIDICSDPLAFSTVRF